MAYKEELTGRLRFIKTRIYDADFVSVAKDLEQEWRVWPSEDDLDYSFEEWRPIPEVWEP